MATTLHRLSSISPQVHSHSLVRPLRVGGRAQDFHHHIARCPCPPAAAAATVTAASLASYPFPALQPGVPSWLADSVRDLAKHIESAPMLQLKLPGIRAAQHHAVPAAVVHTPQLWRGIAEHLSRSDPESVVLVHPISSQEEEASDSHVSAVKARMKCSGTSHSALTGIAVGAASQKKRRSSMDDHKWRLEACAKLLEAGIATPELAGRVGDCCEEEGGASEASSHPNPPPPPIVDDPLKSNVVSFHRGREPGGGAVGDVSYYGVVVQSKVRSEAEGCYILKTVKVSSEHDECTCLHYTLVRVCRGEPVASQLMASWLI